MLDGVAGRVVSSVIGILVTFAVGDLLIKRNYESYVKEKQAFLAASRDAKAHFDSVAARLNAVVAERRNAAQRLNLYAATHDVSGFSAGFEQYALSVKNWNETRLSLEREVNDLVACADDQMDPARKRSADEVLLDPTSTFNTKFVGKQDIVFITRADLDGEMGYCPTKYVFSARTESATSDSGSFETVFEVMRYMHKLYYDSVKRPVVRCAETINRILSVKIGECASLRAEKDIGDCLQDSIKRYSPKKICTKEKFGGLASFHQGRFNVIDYRWGVAQELLAVQRSAYVRQACENARVFWGRYFDWSCG